MAMLIGVVASFLAYIGFKALPLGQSGYIFS
jgi:hypothetical protein